MKRIGIWGLFKHRESTTDFCYVVTRSFIRRFGSPNFAKVMIFLAQTIFFNDMILTCIIEGKRWGDSHFMWTEIRWLIDEYSITANLYLLSQTF
ncbi:hypothetical protein [Sulfobacillus thermosulfidooxidans]|uniref:hypothetical protein n=1 Tax=Sulfobacillus thermosulfidooxidans TaxID=28034 RepID=UPI0006B4DF09|nr:hypothetical protein [Sulfobacillus thermosulfidooxidans]